MRSVLMLMMAMLCLACSQGQDLAGSYTARYTGLSGPVGVIMVLGEDGSGKWEVEGEAVAFSWRARSGALTVHTREGAVLEGVVESGGLRLDVPGAGKLLFVRD